SAADASSLFSAVDRCLRQVLQHTLCTVNRYDPNGDILTRLYSSDPVTYPPGGSKKKSGTSWGKQVLHDKQVFIGEGESAIRQSFDDHNTIRSLGLRSVINIPVVSRGVCLGTLNFLMTTEKVEPAMVQWAQLAGLLVTPGFLDLPAG